MEPESSASAQPLLALHNLVQEFPARGIGGGSRRVVQALSGISLNVWRGETLGIIGETGSGKSTLAHSILQLPPPKSGTVEFRGQELTRLGSRALLEQRRAIQMVFQDPYGSLDPRWRVADIVAEPLIGLRIGTQADRVERVKDLLDRVGLPASRYANRRPRELSGGQCQRVAIARALAPQPELLICDEAVSSLDALVQQQILDLLAQLRGEFGLTCLFISHDLLAVNRIAERVAVLHVGQLCEVGPTRSMFRFPRHPYTAALLGSLPRPRRSEWLDDNRSALISGPPSTPIDPRSGCRFRERCPRARAACAETPRLVGDQGGHQVACHFPIGG